MDTQTLETPISESVFQVDATRPFRSVKEAVAILGERLLHSGIRSSPNRPSGGVGNAESCSSDDATQSPDKSLGLADEKDVATALDEPYYSSENTLGPSETTIALNQVVQSPTESTNTPTNPSATGPSLDALSFLPENTFGPTETRSIPSKQILESTMYEPSHSPSPEEPGKENLTQSLNKATNPFRKQTVGSSFDGPSHSSEITRSGSELANNKLTPPPGNPSKENHGNIVHGNDIVTMLMVLKKLEADLQETKTELKLLKERGSETEVAIASLNAEFHKNMSKIAKAEAAEAAKAATKSTSTNEGRNKEMETRDEARKKTDLIAKTIDSPTLAQILSISDYEGYFKENKLKTRKRMKKKPIIPLVTDLFVWKKKSSPSFDISEPLFSKMYFT